MKNILRLLGMVCVCVLLVACKPNVPYSVIPEITEFVSFVPDTTELIVGQRPIFGNLTFRFTDGDGDVGSNSQNDDPNFFVNYYEKTDGKFILTTNSPISSRLPQLSEQVQEAISVQLSLKVEIGPADTMCMEFYLKDRAGNQSNKMTTPTIVIVPKK
jgi:hypothetical protein